MIKITSTLTDRMQEHVVYIFNGFINLKTVLTSLYIFCLNYLFAVRIHIK